MSHMKQYLLPVVALAAMLILPAIASAGPLRFAGRVAVRAPVAAARTAAAVTPPYGRYYGYRGYSYPAYGYGYSGYYPAYGYGYRTYSYPAYGYGYSTYYSGPRTYVARPVVPYYAPGPVIYRR
jgi:hypothetical protein